MRVHLHGDEAAGEFAGQLLAIGDGKYPIDTGPDIIQLPENIGTFACSSDELVSKVYPDLISNFRNITWLSEQCILALRNETTRTINATLVAQLPGESVEYRSLDSVLDDRLLCFKILQLFFLEILFKFTYFSQNYLCINVCGHSGA